MHRKIPILSTNFTSKCAFTLTIIILYIYIYIYILLLQPGCFVRILTLSLSSRWQTEKVTSHGNMVHVSESGEMLDIC